MLLVYTTTILAKVSQQVVFYYNCIDPVLAAAFCC